jgi:acetoacetyl-CoA synthetase
VLWTPDQRSRERARLTHYLRWLEQTRGLGLRTYPELHRWSVEHLEDFWASIWEYFDIKSETPWEQVLTTHRMPGARWFTGTRLNYAEHALRRRGPEIAIVARSQTRGPLELSWDALSDAVARTRAGLRRLGVGEGDRVAGFLPNIPEAVVAFLATASLGAIWSSCSPEFGVRSVTDRWGQIEPKVLFTVDGYRWGERAFDRRAEVADLCRSLPSLEHVVTLPYLDPDASAIPTGCHGVLWQELVADPGPPGFLQVPFDHPLTILFSSGTTGLPKAIVHGHGGITVEHLKIQALMSDIGPDDRYFQVSTTAWMMWNMLVSGLLVGATIVCCDGDPAYPDTGGTWAQAAETKTTNLGTSASYLAACRKAGLRPGATYDLGALRVIGSTGSPLAAEVARWVYADVKRSAMLFSSSGGTDVCTGFVVGVPLLPIVAGEITGPSLGVAAAAFDPEGHPVVGEQGELVITEPMPSMPNGFWNDPGGDRYRSAYFDVYPGVWRHGDWITFTDRGTCVISGRSDATLNRGGVRLGTAEFYEVVEDLPQISDSLVVHLEDPEGGPGRLVLLVALAPGAVLDDELTNRIRASLREQLSPRHVPDEIHAIPAVPRTLTGKKLEVPAKRILLGAEPDTVASGGAITGMGGLQAIAELAHSS